jgi:hypothetical protein
MELRAIRSQLQESPPPPPAGVTVREWFAGLAMMNPELMRDLSPMERVTEAVRLADELIKALSCPRTPSQESMAVPIEEEGLRQSWDNMANAVNASHDKERRERTTKPEIRRRATAAYDFRATIPPPPPTTPSIHFKRASDTLIVAALKVGLPCPTVHSSFRPEPEE